MNRTPQVATGSFTTVNGPSMSRRVEAVSSVSDDQVRAFSLVYAVANKLRDIGLEACEAMAAAKATGLDEQAILQTLRFEFDDWEKKIPLLRTTHELLDAVGARTSLDLAVMIDDPIASADDLEVYHRKQGAKAFAEGKTLHHDPYQRGEPESEMWRAGLNSARNSARRVSVKAP